jgi:flagella basal body P-ring formation protein FlgA
MTRQFLAAGLSLLPLWIAQAGPARQDPTLVAAAVRAAIGSQPGATVTLGPIQGAAYMQSCGGPLGVSVSGVEPYEQAAVHCGAPDWTLYVTVTIAASTPVVVAARPIAAGQAFGPGDLTIRDEPDALDAGRAVYHDPDQLTGATAVMNLPAGTIISGDDIDEPVAVVAGQLVAVAVHAGGVDLSVNAIADQTGRIGDTILLTNPSSGRRFTAQVTAAGVVVQLQG